MKRRVYVEGRLIGETVNPSHAAQKVVQQFKGPTKPTQAQVLKAMKGSKHTFTVSIKDLVNVMTGTAT